VNISMGWFFVAGIVVVVAVGAAVGLGARPRRRLPRPRFSDRVYGGFGRVAGFVLVIAAGSGVVWALGWTVGYAARELDPADHTAFTWIRPQAHISWLSPAMRVLTQMGNNRETQIVTAVAAVVLGVLWWVRRRGITALTPAVLMVVAYELEHQMQHTLKLLAHRGHPPTTLGTFPSGGCARLLCVAGLAIYLLLRYFNANRSRIGVGVWTLFGVAVYIEGFARVYLSQHWVTDVIGGWIVGAMLLAVMVGAAMVLDHPVTPRQPDPGTSVGAGDAGPPTERHRVTT
jgi:membrane-associated phospholipid phosphatase